VRAYAFFAGVFLYAASSAATESPRLLRFVSDAFPNRGLVCYGLVVDATDGMPARVFNLGSMEKDFCTEDHDSPEPVERLRRALDAAAVAWGAREWSEGDLEILPVGTRSRRIAPPVVVTQTEIDERRKFVIGAGLNYAAHRAEVGAEGADPDALLLFPKSVAPTGPYAPVRAGARIGASPPQPVRLLDYEVELGFVLLADIDLNNPPGDAARFLEDVAFFVANDVSDREPIFLDNAYGFTRAKSRPTYLPIGPWLVHGRFLAPRTAREGKRALRLQLSVSKADAASSLRQSDTTASMIRGPWEIVSILSARFRRGEVICMRDAKGTPRYLHDERGIVPAGSLVITGTPGGTAVKAPDLAEKLWLFAKSGFSEDAARRAFVERVHQEAGALGYLEPGDRVDVWIERLGRQRWRVQDVPPKAVYGVAVSADCRDA
jgi:2-keto-4-pentenoate hydratase/2-oxohepta-3-ene-1,7-dioic acid hydratase in catechol pathway